MDDLNLQISPNLNGSNKYLVTSKGVVSKNLQKPYICGRGGYNSWSDDVYQVDKGQQITMVGTIGLGAIPPLATFCRFFMDKAF